jgi:Transposase DDE domain
VDYRETLSHVILNTIEDESFKDRSRSEDGGKGFSRNRKLPFTHLIVLLTQGLTRSIQREVNSFYQKLQQSDFSLQHVTKGAFSRARARLNPWAFGELNQVCNKHFYDHAPYRRWRGFRLLAIDGSTAVLPKHKTISEQFGVVNFGPYANSPRSVARISLLYDVLNFMTLDGQMDSYSTGERELARKHFDQVEPGEDLVLMDRGYPSLSLMYDMQSRGIHYCIRMREDWWHSVRDMLVAGQKDKVVTFELPEKDRQGIAAGRDGSYKIKCRLVAAKLPSGQSEVLCTSVIDNTKIPYEYFADLYRYRWNIEEGYKLYKSRLQLEAFSGKTATAVKQDFFAKVFIASLTAALALPVDEKLKQEQQTTNRKHPHKANKTNALSFVKEIIAGLFIKKLIRSAILALDKFLAATTEIVRPNRRNPRKKIKKKPPSMNYKQL